MKLVCHCTPSSDNEKAHKAECWIFNSDLTPRDPDWTAFHTQTQLQSLGFSVHGTSNLSFIPTTVIQSLKHLEKLTIEYAQIHEIFGFAFGNFTRIKNITLPKNHIKSINSYAFANHMELQELILSSNDIHEIDPFAFTGLPSLKRLNLAENRIQEIHDDTFESLEKLSNLILSFNAIDLVTRETFKGLGNLRHLKLDHNKLKFVDEEALIELMSLVELDLGHNMIETISERAFDGLNNLERLNLEDNRLKTLERGLFKEMPALSYLNLMRNSLETVTLHTIQPLMNNLVNHTGMLYIKDNEFICDCRLAWVFDLKNRTKNFELKYSLEEIECMMKPKDRPTGGRIRVNLDDVMKKQVLNDETDYYEDESFDDKRTNLLQLKQRELPCPQQYREQFEHPSTREFIGFDLSWIHSSATKSQKPFAVLFLALITNFACTLAAFSQ